MKETPRAFIEPAFGRTSFSCPHCGIHAHHVWSALFHANPDPRHQRVTDGPNNTAQFAERLRADHNSMLTDDILGIFAPSITRRTWLDEAKPSSPQYDRALNEFFARRIAPNVLLTRCASCGNTTHWLWSSGEARMIWPRPRSAPPPNPDLPESVKPDYNEAAAIAEDSPRAAAALLRLCVEKLCLYVLGRDKGNLNDMIGELMARGLDESVRKMLDIVRVAGNQAVHPGSIDLADDRDTVQTLFALVNEIAEQTISKPKRIDAIYMRLPERTRAAIDRRDTGKPGLAPSSRPPTTSSNES